LLKVERIKFRHGRGLEFRRDNGDRPAVPDDEYSPEETVRRMKWVLQRAFSKPPQPHGCNPQTPPTPKRKTGKSPAKPSEPTTRKTDEA
jgi:hypothetical protein